MNRLRPLLLAGAALALVAAACTPETTTVLNTTNDNATGITVDGYGEVYVTPDTAHISVGVQVLADTVSEARTRAADGASRVIESLKANGVEDRDIRTGSFGIFPRYDYSSRGQARLIGYEVTNTVDVTLRDIDAVGSVIDAAAAAGGDDVRVHGIRFDVEDRSEALAQAREQAMGDALDRAEQLARHGGVTLGTPVSITETRSEPVFPFALREAAYSDGATPIEAGSTAVSVRVTVTYAIS